MIPCPPCPVSLTHSAPKYIDCHGRAIRIHRVGRQPTASAFPLFSGVSLISVCFVLGSDSRSAFDRMLVAAGCIITNSSSYRSTSRWFKIRTGVRRVAKLNIPVTNVSPFQTEYRRRLWSYLYHADKLYSLVLGRPPSISDSYADAQ